MIRLTSAAVGGLMLLATSTISSAQDAGVPAPVRRIASVVPGSIHGIVQDEAGTPVAGAMVTALGSTTAVAVTDRNGRFEFRTLPPGPYMVRAHLGGYTAPRPQLVEVRTSTRTGSFIALRKVDAAAAPILAAGFGAPARTTAAAAPDDEAIATPETGTTSTGAGNSPVDPGETAWRLRHARRGILRTATIPGNLLAGGTPSNVFAPLDLAGRAAGSSMRVAANFITDTPFSGQVNFLTTGLFEAPRDLFSADGLARGIAYFRLTAPAGLAGDWTVRGALTQADISSWIVSGSYKTRETAQHQYGFGLSYSTLRYEGGGNPMALREVVDGSRNVGEIFGFDTVTILPQLSLTYGGRYSQYDYLQDRNLMSPRFQVTLTPGENVRITGVLSARARAPGAEEFLPPAETGIWLPPQRTFSSFAPGRPLAAEHTRHAEVGIERDLGPATVGLRAFHQRVEDQLLTLFGADIPNQPSSRAGHYFVGNVGDAKATGGAASVGAAFSKWVRGSVEYSLTNARLRAVEDLQYIVIEAPSAVRPQAEHIHDVAATIETRVPETATRVLVFYRVGNAFAHGAQALDGGTATRRAFDSRFDLQVRQSLPFMAFGTARWEMLAAVGNFFHDRAAAQQSIYDELLVVRPPKRIIGGITMMF